MMILGIGLLALIAVSALAIVRTDDVTNQVIALSFYGLLFALMFFIFQAPDVALSQVTVGAIALPLMVMLAITRMKHREELRQKKQEKGK
ncbi:MAG TPA: hydrogenase subunit MbhD domain-containing protein [Acidobacteriaceae bacterium]|nr:hydrogenase subunit MbhD domain-containing protein [Acidobacteriaceae bacterium]